MSEEEKTEVEKAMEKDCIVLFVVEKIIQAIRNTAYAEGAYPDVKCRGPACATYNVFTNRCGLLR